VKDRELDQAALRGEPSYVWRDGQERRLQMIVDAAGPRMKGRVLENGCGVGLYAQHLIPLAGEVVGLEYEFERARAAVTRSPKIVNGRGETLPFASATFDFVLSHEVLEHVNDDRASMAEMLRVLRPGGRAAIFCPNRGYPFETHGLYWAGKYHFGNKLFVNYLPNRWRSKLAPHVRAYTSEDLARLLKGLQAKIVTRTVIFGGYDNIIARYPVPGRVLRAWLQSLEETPLRVLGLSHYWVVERV
jgi:SAM-dependent methyltransferase